MPISALIVAKNDSVAAQSRHEPVRLVLCRISRRLRRCGSLSNSQYTSRAFTEHALNSGLVPSMGSIGDCYDNAMMESFWGRMQSELLNRQRWRTRLELANAIFEYLEIFHRRQRRHSAC